MTEQDDNFVPLRFSKRRVEYVLDCVREGKPIAPEADIGWTLFDQLLIAGVLTFGAGTHPSPVVGEAFNLDDLLAAVSFVMQITEQVLDTTYDVDFEEVVQVTIRKGEDRVEVDVVEGYKRK